MRPCKLWVQSSVSCAIRVPLIQIVINLDNVVQGDLDNVSSQRCVEIIVCLQVGPPNPVVPALEGLGGPAELPDPASIVKTNDCLGWADSFDLRKLACLNLSGFFQRNQLQDAKHVPLYTNVMNFYVGAYEYPRPSIKRASAIHRCALCVLAGTGRNCLCDRPPESRVRVDLRIGLGNWSAARGTYPSHLAN